MKSKDIKPGEFHRTRIYGRPDTEIVRVERKVEPRMGAVTRWRHLDERDPPRVIGFEPLEPGDPAWHSDELQLYWPFVGAEAWALGTEAAGGGELDENAES